MKRLTTPFLTLKRPSRSGNSSIKIRMHQKPQIRLFLQSEVLRFKTYNKMSRMRQKPKFPRFMPCNQTTNNNTKTTMKNLHYKITNLLLQNPILSIGIGRIMTLGAIFIYIALCGCSTTFYKQVEGEVDVVGITIPDEEFIKLQVISHMNGTKTTVRDISKIKHEYMLSSTNSYFGIINVQELRKGKIEVEPVSTNHVVNINK